MQLDLMYVDLLVCFAWIVAQLPDQPPSFLAVVPRVSVCYVFRCSTDSACSSSSPAVMVATAKGSCSLRTTGCSH